MSTEPCGFCGAPTWRLREQGGTKEIRIDATSREGRNDIAVDLQRGTYRKQRRNGRYQMHYQVCPVTSSGSKKGGGA